jgi:hypothetical protein
VQKYKKSIFPAQPQFSRKKFNFKNYDQGDQIGVMFTYWAILGHFLKITERSPDYWATFSK